jgi:uncharacterized protein (TIGR03086 family)
MGTADRYRRLAEIFDGTVESLDSDDWERPSPCAGWTARDVLAHVLDSEAEIVGKVGLSIERSVQVADDPAGAWHEVRDGMQAILDDPATAGLEYESFGSQTTIADTVDKFFCFDLIVHRWDIARAAGKDIDIPAEDVAAADAVVDSLGQMFYDYGASGPPVAVAEDASAQDRLLGRAGRDPAWSPKGPVDDNG